MTQMLFLANTTAPKRNVRRRFEASASVSLPLYFQTYKHERARPDQTVRRHVSVGIVLTQHLALQCLPKI